MAESNAHLNGGPWAGRFIWLESGVLAMGRFTPSQDDGSDYSDWPGDYVQASDAPLQWVWVETESNTTDPVAQEIPDVVGPPS
ncbi:MAG: hypothetical protein JWM76_346 [Pseudonocardiales bacterium]|nr:hypothetical protein [Pseudonocardiales bacterium]